MIRYWLIKVTLEIGSVGFQTSGDKPTVMREGEHIAGISGVTSHDARIPAKYLTIVNWDTVSMVNITEELYKVPNA